MYSFDLGGIIISPWKARLLCSYPFDVGTVSRKKCSDPNPGMQHCIPGCTPNDWRANGGSEWGSRGIWCPPVDHTASWESQAERFEAIQFSGQPCAWKPEHLAMMMKLRDGYSEHNKYNSRKTWDDHKYYSELILDASPFTHSLPHSIEAFFFQPGRKDCFDAFDGHKCEAYARAAHRAFLDRFSLSWNDVPLLKLDIFNWQQPFSAMAAPPPSSPSPPPHSPPPRPHPPPPTIYLTHPRCNELMANKKSQLHRLWGRVGWEARTNQGSSCWNSHPGGGARFFDDAWRGTSCNRNWYSGNGGDLGIHGPVPKWANPHFTENAPALLGFDSDINRACNTEDSQHATGCTKANYNILSLYGPKIP